MLKKIEKKNLRKAIIVAGALLILTCMLIAFDSRYIFRDRTFAEICASPRAMLGACRNIVLLYVYLAFMLGIFATIIFFIRKSVISMKQFIMAQENPGKKCALFVAKLIGTFLIAWIIEFVYGHVIVGERNSLGMYFTWPRYVFFLCVLLFIWISVLYVRRKIAQPEKFLLATILIIGFAYCVALPFGTNLAWDDQIHYQMTINLTDPTRDMGSKSEFALASVKEKFSLNMRKTQAYLDYLNDRINVGSGEVKQYSFVYQAVGYMPAAAVIMVAKLFGMQYPYIFYLGKYATLLCYAILVYYGVKKLKWGKSILAVIALLPSVIFLASNYSYDYWINGCLFLSMGYLFGELQTPESKITKKSILIMLVASFFGMSRKPVYCFMVLFFFMLPESKFENREKYKKFRLLVIFVILALLVSFMLPFMISTGSASDARGGSDVDAIGQVRFILSQPLQYTKILLDFLFGFYLKIDNASSYTADLAYLGNAYLNQYFVVLLFAATLLDRQSGEREVLNAKRRSWIWIISFGTICIVASALYVAFTPVGLETINGCQGRYLLPLLFPIFYSMGHHSMANNIDKRKLFGALVMIESAFSILTMWTLCISKYV